MKKIIYSMIILISVIFLGSCVSFGPKIPDLHKAIEENKLEQVEILVKSGANLDETYYGKPALVYAAIHKKNDVLSYLVTQKQDVKNIKDAIGEALHNNNYEGAKILIDADIININENINLLGWILVDKNFSLDQRMAKIKEVAGDEVSSPYFLVYGDKKTYVKIRQYFNINFANKVDELGRTILHIAAMRNDDELLEYLLENNFDINSLDNNNHTALFYAITTFGPSIDWKNSILEDEKNAKINFISDMPYYSDPRASQQRQVKNVLTLLDAKIEINQQNKAGWTVLHFARAAYPEGLSDLLISKGANKEIKTNFNRTADDIKALRK